MTARGKRSAAAVSGQERPGQKRQNIARLWWKRVEIEIPPLARALAQTYLRQTGVGVESPPLFIAHLVQQAHVHPQALADLLADSAKERGEGE